MKLFELLKNAIKHIFNQENPGSGNRYNILFTVLILSAAIAFAITWLFSDPSPKSLPDSDMAIQTTQKDPQKTEVIANKLVDIIANRSKRKYVSKIEPESSGANAGKEWSADTFLDVIKAPDMNSKTATTIVKVTQKPTESRQDPYVSSLLDEAVSLAVLPVEKQRQGKERSDQASFQTTGTVGQSNVAPIFLNPEGLLVVQNGDSLSKIALKMYGDGTAYQRIFDENRDILDDPHQLSPQAPNFASQTTNKKS